ncbi:MAG: type VI secretion system protein TssA [Gemmatimonadaceae bacterium]
MPLQDELLNPIAGDNPGGADVRYEPIFDKIKEARREDEDIPQGDWATERKTADWAQVVTLATDVLANKSKDVQVAAWLSEALLRRQGFPGLKSGLDVTAGLIEKFWDGLYPEIDEGDLEMRAGPLEWMGRKFTIPIMRVPLDKAGNDALQIKEARTIPNEEAAAETPEKKASRDSAIADGKPTPEAIEAGFAATPKTWYKTLIADIDGCLASLKTLDTVCDEKFGNDAPGLAPLRDALTEVHRMATQSLKRKLELDPDPVEIAPVVESAADGGSGNGATSGAAASGGALAAEPVSRDDAAARIASAARFIRQSDPFNPASYMLLRGFRWGELRVGGTGVDPKLLEAPPTNVRTRLKGLLLDGKWRDLLEVAEGVMGTAQGRGWIDLQRYALTACEALGNEYDAVATAMRGALRSLLIDLPHLVDMTLMDDTPTANAETRAWLELRIVTAQETTPRQPRGSVEISAQDLLPGRDPFSLASAEVRAGHADKAISMLMREVARQKTNRARFLSQVQLAHVMVDSGHDAVAMPVLEQLIAAVEQHKLEEWEAGDVVAAPLALMYRALERLAGDETLRQSLYLRICRLDPLQAIGFTQQ